MVRLDRDDAVWCLVMFDLPVKTARQRREASAFRNYLLDLGLSMVQYSVYVQYLPRVAMAKNLADKVLQHLPDEGQVRILQVTDAQWSKALRFFNAVELPSEGAPSQLTIFGS